MKKRVFGRGFKLSREGVFLISIPAIALAFFSIGASSPFELITSSLLIFLVTPFLITRFILKESVYFMGWRKGNVKRGAIGTIAGWLAFAPFLYLLAGKPDFSQLYPIFPQMRTDITGLVVMEILVMLPVFIGLQSFIFGYAYGGLVKMLGKGTTLLLISLVMMPLLQLGKPWMEIVLATFIGFAACWIRERSRSVLFPVVFGWGLSFILDAFVIYILLAQNLT